MSVSLQHLPHLLREVAEIAGIDAALQLARARGGRKLYVPEHPTSGLVAEIGEAAADALTTLYGRDTVVVPLGPTGSAKVARRAVAEALGRGCSAAEAAVIGGVTTRTVHNIRRRRREAQNSRQGRLFEE